MSCEGCPECKRMAKKEKTIYDHTPYPIEYVERRQIKEKTIVVTLIYRVDDTEDREKILSFFDAR